MKKNDVKTGILLLTVLLFGCVIDNDDPELIIKQFNIEDLNYSELYYTWDLEWYLNNDPFQNTVDDSGVAMSLLPHGGTVWYYNPTDVGFWGTHIFDRYMKVQDSVYLDYALRHRDKLIDLMDEDGYLEYRLDYDHYDRTYNNPWYSGLAQGQALSLFSRLAYYAQDSLSEVMARKVFETLNPYNTISQRDIFIDKGYAWIEEYPNDPPDHTFGGMMRSTIGVYDYYHCVNSDETVENVLFSYLTTIKENMQKFRNPGGVYFYDLVYKQTYRSYQKVVVNELNFLTIMTQDSSFTIFADTLKSDYWE